MSGKPNHETLWAREGDVMQAVYPQWSPFASRRAPEVRAAARVLLHGYDFRVESDRGVKRMVVERG